MTNKRKRVIDDDDSESEENGTETTSPPSKQIKLEDDDHDSPKPTPSTSNVTVKEEQDQDMSEAPTTPMRSRKGIQRRRTAVKLEDDDNDDDNGVKKEEDGENGTKKKKAAKKKGKQIELINDDDDDDSDESEQDSSSDDSDFEFDEKPKRKAQTRKTPAKKTPKKEVKKETKKEAKATPAKSKGKGKVKDEDTPKKGKKAASKKTKKEEDGEEEEEEESEIYKWWLEDDIEEKLNSEIKWKTLTHNGVMFPPEYVPHGIPVTYSGKDVKLTPEQEELATMYALMRETEYYNKPLFQKNFWSFWKERLGKGHTIKDLKKCDFTKIWEWHLQEKEKKLNRSKEEKKKEKEEKDKIEEPYKWCLIDGRKEKVGNFRVEPPALFRGRGEHPKQGFLKKRIVPEDITINIGKQKDAPKPPKGHKWKEVITNNKVTWLASWKDPITNGIKYVNLASSSSFKGVSDFLKYQNARSLKEKIEDIRKAYRKNWKDEDPKVKQLGVAMYFIDKLALRVGNEKNEDEEADTVGCCSLRCEHITLTKPRSVEFDFLGKDSIRYHNTVEVEPAVFKCLKEFKKGKKKSESLFDLISSVVLNKELKQFMPTLTAKVFRTFNASLTLDQQLTAMDSELDDMNVTEKIAMYNKANREVSILCNHQKTVSKTHDSSMNTLDQRIDDQKTYLKRLKDALKQVEKKGYDEVKAKWDEAYEAKLEEYEEGLKEFEKKQKDLEEQAKKKGVTVAVLTGTTKRDKPPKKPAKQALPRTVEGIEKAIDKTKEKIKDLNTQKTLKEENKTVALGTARINYCDPRITVAWCKRNNVPVNKLFSKTLMDKFPWAMDAPEDYRF